MPCESWKAQREYDPAHRTASNPTACLRVLELAIRKQKEPDSLWFRSARSDRGHLGLLGSDCWGWWSRGRFRSSSVTSLWAGGIRQVIGKVHAPLLGYACHFRRTVRWSGRRRIRQETDRRSSSERAGCEIVLLRNAALPLAACGPDRMADLTAPSPPPSYRYKG